MEPGRRSRDRVVSNFLQVTTWVYLGSFASSTTEGVTCSRGVRCGGSHSTSTCAGPGWARTLRSSVCSWSRKSSRSHLDGWSRVWGL